MAFEQPPLPRSVRLPSDSEITRLVRVHGRLWMPDSTEAGMRCPTCLGKRVYRCYKANSRSYADLVEWVCRCEDQYVLHRFLMSRGLGLAEMRMSWMDIAEPSPKVMEFLDAYSSNVEAYVSNGMGVVLWGPHGTGKSSYAHLFMRALMSQGFDAYFIRFKPMLELWRNVSFGHGDEADRSWFTKRVLNAQVLVIDDIGKEYVGVASRGSNENDAASRIEDVLRQRNSAGRPTFITSNENPEAFGVRYGRSVMEMITERSLVCEVPGDNFRDAYRERTKTEMALGLSRPIGMG